MITSTLSYAAGIAASYGLVRGAWWVSNQNVVRSGSVEPPALLGVSKRAWWVICGSQHIAALGLLFGVWLGVLLPVLPHSLAGNICVGVLLVSFLADVVLLYTMILTGKPQRFIAPRWRGGPTIEQRTRD